MELTLVMRRSGDGTRQLPAAGSATFQLQFRTAQI